MPGRDSPPDPPPVPRPRRHSTDRPGQAFGADRNTPIGPPTNDRNSRPAKTGEPVNPEEAISSRTTTEEARDLLALRRAKRGEDAAFAELLREHDAAMRSFVAVMVGGDYVDRVTADAYIKAYRGLPLAPTTSPRIWLLGIADGACRDAIRRGRRDGSRHVPLSPPAIPLDLPADQRVMVALVDAAGLTVREASRLSGGTVSEARVLLNEGRGRVDPLELSTSSPEHDPAFWNDLGKRLLVARDAPAARLDPSDAHPGDGHHVDRSAGAIRGPVAPSLQTGRAARGMARRVAQRSPRQVPWRSLGIAATTVVVLAALVAMTLALAKNASHRDAELGLTSTKILGRLDQALNRDSVIAGTATVTISSDPVLKKGIYRFTRTAEGAYRVRSDSGAWDESWNPSTSTFTQVRNVAKAPRALVRTGVAPGPPQVTATAGEMVGDLLADALRVMHDGTNRSALATTATSAPPPTSTGMATTTTEPGVPVWVMSASMPIGSAISTGTLPGVGRLTDIIGDQVRLVADQSLVLPRRFEVLRAGRVVFDLRFDDLSIGQNANSDVFSVTVPEGARVTSTSSGFEAIGIGDASQLVGRRVLTPTYLPEGFVLVAVAANATTKVLVLGYRNGSQQFTLTTKPAAAGNKAVADPFGRAASGSSSRGLTVGSGALAGKSAWYSPLPLPHLWVDGGRLTVVASGDPSMAELTKIVSSMQ